MFRLQLRRTTTKIIAPVAAAATLLAGSVNAPTQAGSSFGAFNPASFGVATPAAAGTVAPPQASRDSLIKLMHTARPTASLRCALMPT